MSIHDDSKPLELKKWRHTEAIRRRQREAQVRECIDFIPAKINEVGYENISEEEKQILKNAGEYFRSENS